MLLAFCTIAPQINTTVNNNSDSTQTTNLPSFSPERTDFDWDVNVAISSSTKDAIIYYTTDGTRPNDMSNRYTAPIDLHTTTTIRAVAYRNGLKESDIASRTYHINGKYEWTKTTGGSSKELATKIVSDSSDNMYIASSFYNTVDFGAVWDMSDIKEAVGDSDMALTKIRNDNQYEWTISIGGLGEDLVKSVVVDQEDNIYIAGYFNNTVDFGITTKTSSGNKDAFILKLNGSGIISWVKSFGSIGDDIINDISDCGDSICVVGIFNNTVDFRKDFGGSDIKTADGSSDIFITRLTKDGTYVWTKQIGSNTEDVANGITYNDRSLYITGSFSAASINFAEDFGSQDIKRSNGLEDVFITKMYSDGTYAWTKTMGGDGSDKGIKIISDSYNIYVAGTFTSDVNFAHDFGGLDAKLSAGYSDVFLTEISHNMAYAWTKQFGGLGTDLVYDTITDSEHIYLSGAFSGKVNFAQDFAHIADSKNSAGNKDCFVLKMDKNASYEWTKTFGGSNNDAGHSLNLNKAAELTLLGTFEGATDFGKDFGAKENYIESNGLADIFMSKLSYARPSPE